MATKKKAKTEKPELTVQHLFIGKQVSPEMDEAVEEKLFTLAKNADPELKIVYLDKKEMARVTATRVAMKEEETVTEFLTNESNRKDSRALAERLHKEIKERNGDPEQYYPKKMIKNLTSFSWSKFNSVVDTLNLFGMIDENELGIKIVIKDETSDIIFTEKVDEAIAEAYLTTKRAMEACVDKTLKRKFKSTLTKLEKMM